MWNQLSTQCENLEILLPRRFRRKNYVKSISLVQTLLSRNFCQKCSRLNRSNFHNYNYLSGKYFVKMKLGYESYILKIDFTKKFQETFFKFCAAFRHIVRSRYKRTYLFLRIHNDKILPMNLKISDTKLLSVWYWLAIIFHKVDLNQNSHFSNFFSFILSFLFCFQFRNWDVVAYLRC